MLQKTIRHNLHPNREPGEVRESQLATNDCSLVLAKAGVAHSAPVVVIVHLQPTLTGARPALEADVTTWTRKPDCFEYTGN